MQTFTYDNAYRLESARASGGQSGAGDYALENYAYDAATGNLSSKAGVSYIYGHQAANCPQASQSRAHAVVRVGTDRFFCYDQNGNMTRRTISGSEYNLTYDPENHMTGVTGAATANFTYNGDGSLQVLARSSPLP